jgi:hypothetical protein
MSKNSPARIDQKNLETISSPVPAIRDVRPIDSIQPHHGDSSGMLVLYKDLNAANPVGLNSTQHLFIAFAVFVMLGLGILMGTQMNQRRQVASVAAMNAPAGAEVKDEHYHYDKSCYTTETGEKVCMTRTSQK